jgi:hypothetical protein
MNRKSIAVAALALVISNTAFADEAYWKIPPDSMLVAVPFSDFQRALWSHVQLTAIQNVAWVEVATSDGRCSSAFTADQPAIRQQLAAGAVIPPSSDATLSDLRALYADYYLHNATAFCNFAREQFGPSGKKQYELKSNSSPMLSVRQK